MFCRSKLSTRHNDSLLRDSLPLPQEYFKPLHLSDRILQAIFFCINAFNLRNLNLSRSMRYGSYWVTTSWSTLSSCVKHLLFANAFQQASYMCYYIYHVFCMLQDHFIADFLMLKSLTKQINTKTMKTEFPDFAFTLSLSHSSATCFSHFGKSFKRAR